MRGACSQPCARRSLRATPPQAGDHIRIEDVDVPLREWLAQAHIERQVKKRFARFLNRFTCGAGDAACREYARKLDALCAGARPAPRARARS